MGCYFCGAEVTGVEHIPPKCFFPKDKRKNLITVESCDFHNQEKSKEDEYIRAILLASIKLDGKKHIEVLRNTNTRALGRSVERGCENITKKQAKEILELIEKYKEYPFRGAKVFDEIDSKEIMSLGLISLVHRDTQEETALDCTGNEIQTTSFAYNEKRFEAFFQCMARGIFFYEIGERWEGRVSILPHTFLKDDAPQRDRDLSNKFLQHFNRVESKGFQKEYFDYEGGNMVNPETGDRECIFFNFCIFDTFLFTAVFGF